MPRQRYMGRSTTKGKIDRRCETSVANKQAEAQVRSNTIAIASAVMDTTYKYVLVATQGPP
jgi:hypothetical protein